MAHVFLFSACCLLCLLSGALSVSAGTTWGPSVSQWSNSASIVEVSYTFIPGVPPPETPTSDLALWAGINNYGTQGGLIQTVWTKWADNYFECNTARNEWCLCASQYTPSGSHFGQCGPVSGALPVNVKYAAVSASDWQQTVTDPFSGSIYSSLQTGGGLMNWWGTAQECQSCNGSTSAQLYLNTVIKLASPNSNFGSSLSFTGGTTARGITSSQGGAVWSIAQLFAPAMNQATLSANLLTVLPAAAFSTRLIVSGYSGPAFKVRRGSDGATKDIYFNALGLCDILTLMNFVGTSSNDYGYVAIWYDQSGQSNHASQSNTAQQPVLVSAGQVVMVGNQPSVLFNGASSTYLRLSSYPFQHSTTAAAYFVNSIRTIQSWQRYFDFGSGTNENFFATPTSSNTFRITVNEYGAEQGDAGQLISSANQVNLAEFHHQGVGAQMTAATTMGGRTLTTAGHQSITVAPSALNNVANNFIGRSQYASDPYFDGWISEIYFYGSDPLLTSSNAAQIRQFVQNIEYYYATY